MCVFNSIPEVRSKGTDDYDDDEYESLLCEASEAKISAPTKQLKNGRAAGVDIITAELLKLGEETAVKWLTELAASTWQLRTVQEDWVK